MSVSNVHVAGATAPRDLSLLYRATASARRVLGGRGTRWLYGTPLMAPLRGVLRACAPGGTTMVEVCYGRLRGARMLVDLSCEKYYWLGTHEEHVQALLAEHVRAGMTVYDIGAHIGFFSLQCAQLVGPRGHVYAFEPRVENAERLRANAKANGATNIDVRPLAVSDASGEAAFVTHESSLEGCLAQDGAASSVSVRTESIDALVRDGMPPPDFIKIDVEGAEDRVIRGAARTIARHRPVMLIEIHTPEAGRGVVEALPCGYVFRDVETRLAVGPSLAAAHYLAWPAGDEERTD